MADGLRYAHIVSFVRDTPWAVLPSKLAEITGFLARRAAGDVVDAETLAELRAAARDRPKLRANGDIAVLPLYGTIVQRAGMLSDFSGGTSIEEFRREFRALLHDPSVAAIVLDVDSPGGAVPGVEEMAAELYRARGVKPISAVADTLCASAAYWLASAADELVVSPSAEVGSIGVFGAHEDWSRWYDQAGITTTLISAGRFKTEGNPFEPLSDEARAAFQKRVDESYDMFVRAVARGRGVPVATVRGGFGEGRLVGAREAVQLGMADRVATLDDVVATVARRRTASVGSTSASVHVVAADGWVTSTRASSVVPHEQPAVTMEQESEAVLMAAEGFVERVRVLAARRERDGRALTPAHVAMMEAHRERYLELAEALGELVREPVDQARVRALEAGFLALEARRLGVAV